MKVSQLPGVKVHKSLTDALNSISGDLEQHHFSVVNREKAKAKAAKKAPKGTPG